MVGFLLSPSVKSFFLVWGRFFSLRLRLRVTPDQDSGLSALVHKFGT